MDVSQIALLVCDVDGVLTEGAIIYGSRELELKAFNTKDGLGMKLAEVNGFPVVWLTGRSSEVVERRARELGVSVQQGAMDKAAGLRAIAARCGVTPAQIAYLGDDLNDLPALRLAGLPLAVADAVPEVIAAAAFVTTAPGGRGAVREVLELILRGQGRWEAMIDGYLAYLHGERPGQTGAQ